MKNIRSTESDPVLISKGSHHRKYPFFLSPYLLFIPFFFFFLVIILFPEKPWAQTAVLSEFIGICLYFFVISAFYTFQAYLLNRGTRFFRIAGLLSTLNALIYAIGIYLMGVAKNFFTFLVGLACLSYAFISPNIYTHLFKIKSEDGIYIFSSIGLTTDTWLVLSGRTIVDKNNQLKPVDRFLGNDLITAAKNLRKNVDTKKIEKNSWKDSIRILFYLVFYLFITAPIYIPFTFLLVFTGFFIPFLMPIGILLAQIYVISAFIASFIIVEISKDPIHNPNIGSFRTKEDAYFLAIAIILSMRSTWLAFLIGSFIYPAVVLINNFLIPLPKALLIVSQLITEIVSLLVILNVFNFTKELLKTLRTYEKTQSE